MTEEATPPTTRPRLRLRLAAALLATGTILLPALGFFVVALVHYHYRCDDGCGGTGWAHTRDSPVWAVQFWLLAVPGMLGSIAVIGLLAIGSTRGAALALAMSISLLVAWFFLPVITGGGRFHFGIDPSRRSSWFWLSAIAVMLAGGAVAILTERQGTRRSTSAPS